MLLACSSGYLRPARGELLKDELEQIEREAWIARLEETVYPAPEQTPAAVLESVWPQVPKALRSDSEVLAVYALRLDDVGSGAEAEKLLRKTLGKRWAGSLVGAYARLASIEATQRFEQAQRWTKKHGDDADLQRALARLAVEVGDVGTARGHYEQALALREDRVLRLEFARFLHGLGDAEAAAEMFDRALPLRADALAAVVADEDASGDADEVGGAEGEPAADGDANGDADDEEGATSETLDAARTA